MYNDEYTVAINTVRDLRTTLMSIPDDAYVCANRKKLILHAYPDLGLVSLESEEEL